MTQVADGDLRQNTPHACGDTQTEMNFAPEAFNRNQTGALVLPLLCESQKFVWVYSNEVDLQPVGVAELDKAFDRFPYLTQKETAALAKRCSLHPGQVKVWFMVQRLRYGISWDCEDIQGVKKKFRSSQGTAQSQYWNGEEVKEDQGKKQQRKTKESGGKKAGKATEEEAANRRGMMGEDVSAQEQLERRVKEEQLKTEKDRKVENVEKGKRSTQKKRKRIEVTDEMAKKSMKQDGDGVVVRAEEVKVRSGRQVESGEQKSTQSEATPSPREKENANRLSVQECAADKSFAVPLGLVLQAQTKTSPLLRDYQTELLKTPEVILPTAPSAVVTPLKGSSEGKEMETWLDRELKAELTNHSVFISGVCKLKEVMEVSPVTGGSYTSAPQQDPCARDVSSPSARPRCSTKTHTQLTMMKMAFCRSQYPSHGEYDHLATLIGIPRTELVQWFGDIRYYIKKVRPRWMNEAQHSQALANIRYRQCLHTLAKAFPDQDIGLASWDRKLGEGESCGKDEIVKMSPE